MNVRPIGVLRSCFKEKFGTPRQPHLAPGALATLTIDAAHKPEQSLAGLAGFSHVWLVSWFHLNTNKKLLPKVHPPRLQGGKVGLFASRSPHRPNPIGLSLARLVKVEGATLHLAGIDLVDGTPVLDVKPYVPESDHAAGASMGWLGTIPFSPMTVAFTPRALADIAAAETRLGIGGLRELLSDLLKQDIRNPRDRAQSRDGLDLGFFLHDFEARFSVSGRTATVLRLETGTEMHRNPRRRSAPLNRP